MMDDRLAKLVALQSAAKEIASKETTWGKRAREALVESTALSPEGIDYALENCLEHKVGRGQLSSLVRQTKMIGRSHVLLSANVFVAAYRAIAVGLIQSPRTLVRASSRAPVMTQLLHEASGECFELTDDLAPRAGDHFWAYGSDETIRQLRRTLTPGVHFHGHGYGMGLAVFRESKETVGADLARVVSSLARDTIAFDQRGCLSPRAVLIDGSRSFAETICNLLVESLEQWEERVPRGPLTQEEQADALRHEATMTYVGSSVAAGMGMVFLDPEEERVLIPPTGRYLHVTLTKDPLAIIKRLGEKLTTIGFFNGGQLPGQAREAIGDRRYVDLGQMQTPAFDGPVDLRHGWQAETL